MTSTIQNISNINQSDFFIKTPVNKEVNSNISENIPQNEQNQKEDGYFNTKTIIASLSGLAVIGGALWKIKSGRANSSKIPMGNGKNPINELTERIAELRKTVKEEYFAKKQNLIADINKNDEFEDIVPFTNPKDLYNEVQRRYSDYTAKSEKSKEIIKRATEEIKTKIAALKDNTEWIELRKLRKSLIKNLADCKTEDEAKILNDKIVIANDLLINRVYPEEMINYTKLTGIEDKDALGLVRKSFTNYSDFLKEYNSTLTDFSEPILIYANNRFIQKDALKLRYIFPKEMSVIDTNRKSLMKKQKLYKIAEKTYNKYKIGKQEISKESQQSENVQELKRLVKELKSLESENKSKLAT